MGLSVSQLASRAGISPDTVRYYGRLGLLPETGRTGGGHRYYDEAALERLRFIKGAQWFDLRLDEIRELLELSDADGCACEHTREVIERRIAAVDEQQARLGEIRAALCRLLSEESPIGPANGHAMRKSEDMTDTVTTSPPATEAKGSSSCGCCTPPPPLSLDEEIRELQARREAVERRLGAIQTGGTL